MTVFALVRDFPDPGRACNDLSDLFGFRRRQDTPWGNVRPGRAVELPAFPQRGRCGSAL